MPPRWMNLRRDRARREAGGGGRRPNNDWFVRHPFLWTFHITGLILGSLIVLGRLNYLGVDGPDVWATARIGFILVLGNIFALLTISIYIQEHRQAAQRQEQPQAEIQEDEDEEPLAMYEIPPSTEPQQSPPNVGRSNRRSRRRSRHRKGK